MHSLLGMKLAHACLICRMPFGTKFGFCVPCRENLRTLREGAVRPEMGLAIYSLFAWRRDGWPALRLLARRLKGQDQPECWLELALWLIEQRDRQAPGVLVPIPSRGPNHALGFARALRTWTGWPVVEILQKDPGRGHQRFLRRHERRTLNFTRVGDCKPYTNVIIVDDVVTTGATARAAFRSLGRPKNCEVWCLLDRRSWQDDMALL